MAALGDEVREYRTAKPKPNNIPKEAPAKPVKEPVPA